MKVRIKDIAGALVFVALASCMPSGPARCQSRYDRLLHDSAGLEKLKALSLMEENGRLDEIIRALVADPDPLVRLRCAEVLGRVDDDTGTIYYLSKLVRDGDPEVVLSAVFSLGLAGHRKSTEQLTLESISEVLKKGPVEHKRMAIRALGLTRLKAAGEIIVPYLTDFHSTLRAEAAMAVAVLGDSSLAESCVNSIMDPAPRARASALYAIGRLGYKAAAGRIAPLLVSEEAEVRMRAAEALGRLGEKSAVDVIAVLLEDPERMMRIKAAEALQRIGTKKSAEKLEKFLSSDDNYLKSLALDAIAASEDGKFFDKVIPLLDDGSVMVRRSAIAAVFGTGGEKSRQHLLRTFREGNHYDRMAAAEHIGRLGVKEDLVLLTETLQSRTDHFAREGAAAGLGNWPKPEQLLEPSGFGGARPVDVLLDAAKGDDWVVAAISVESIGKTVASSVIGELGSIFDRCATRLESDVKLAITGALGQLASGRGLDPERKEMAVSILRKAVSDADPRVRGSAVQAAGRHGFVLAQDPKQSGKWDRGDPPLAGPALPMGNRRMTIVTSKGQIEIELFGDDAPLVVASIIARAEEGFYNGLNFHRVVPGFVIQGGCPRGDGWGDAGYFLRSQFNARTYERGTVGMANSGKDTPGSQFFIAQTAQPHLDGRYTIVGKVVKGLEIIDLIEVGDTFAIRVGS